MNKPNFLPYQKAFIEDKSRLKILVKGRQIGGTFAVSYWVFERLLTRRNHNVIVCTRDERLAKEFVLNVKKWIQFWNCTCKNKKNIVPDSCINKFEIEFPHANGPSRLITVSSNPDSIAGKSGDLILDEFALHKDPELLWSVAQPVINTSGGTCIILSTQRGRESLFNKLVIEAENDPNSKWSLHRTTFEDAVDQGLMEMVVNPNLEADEHLEPFETRQDFIDSTKASVESYMYDREYMCIPSETATCLLTSEEIQRAINRFKEFGNLQEGGYYFGWDIAYSQLKGGDFATLCIIRVHNGEVELVDAHYFEKGTDYDDQLNYIIQKNKEYRPVRIVGDARAIGSYPVMSLQKKLGSKVIAFMSNETNKFTIFSKVKKFFESGQVRFADDDDAIEMDFLSVERTISKANNILISAKKVNGSHGDIAFAFAYALSEAPEFVPSGEIKGYTTKPTTRIEDIGKEYDPNRRSIVRTYEELVEENRKRDMKNKNKNKNSFPM